jgi:hypothetical protein
MCPIYEQLSVIYRLILYVIFLSGKKMLAFIESVCDIEVPFKTGFTVFVNIKSLESCKRLQK